MSFIRSSIVPYLYIGSEFQMMNKTRRVEVVRPAEKPQQRRPKRCHLCKRMFTFDKYDEHFEQCCRSAQQKVEESRSRTNGNRNTVNRARPSIPVSLPKKETREMAASSVSDAGKGFRIKNVSNASQQSRVQVRNESKMEQPQRREVEIEKKQPVRLQEQVQRPEIKEEKREEPVRQVRSQEPILPIRSSVNHEDSFYNPQEELNHSSTNSISLNEGWEANEQEIDYQNFPSSRPREREETMFTNNNNSNSNQPAEEQQIYDIAGLISNTNSIIEFVNSMNIRGQDQTLNIMIAQLEQLNLIAEQIAQLNQIGRSLAIRMGNIFASRIHELQTAIINQIGIALMRGFSDRAGFQFEAMIQLQPDMRTGFTEAQMNVLFPEKVNINPKECSICLEDVKRSEKIIELQCYHTFHPSCIKQWLCSSKKCPMCRKVQQKPQ